MSGLPRSFPPHRLGAGAVLLSTCALLTAVPARAETQAPAGESSRIATLLETSSTGSGGRVGALVRRVGTPTSYLATNAARQYEPASSIKTLFGVEAENRVAAGTIALSTPITSYAYPSSPNGGNGRAGLCPVSVDEKTENEMTSPASLGTEINRMLQASDNTSTRAIVKNQGGLAPATALAARAGMNSTSLTQDFVGCAYRDGKRNVVTLEDMSRLYEGIQQATITPPAGRDDLLTRIIQGAGGPAYVGDNPFRTVVESEANALGMSQADANAFIAGSRYWQKGGSYLTGCTGNPSTNAPECATAPNGTTIADFSAHGLERLPFRDEAGAAVPRTYTVGAYLYNRRCSGSCTSTTLNGALGLGWSESLRTVIRTGLKSWRQASDPDPVPAFTAPTGVVAGLGTRFDASASSDNGAIEEAEWSFGDGTTGSGTVIDHTYARPGIYDVVLTVRDDSTTARSLTRRVTVAARPTATPAPIFVPAPPALAQDRQAPVMTLRSLAGTTRGRTATLRLTLGEAATASVVVTQAVKGRRAGKRCIATSKPPRRGACKRTVIRLRRTASLAAGPGRVTLPTRSLAPGRYTVTVLAADAAGNTTTKRTTLTVAVRRRA